MPCTHTHRKRAKRKYAKVFTMVTSRWWKFEWCFCFLYTFCISFLLLFFLFYYILSIMIYPPFTLFHLHPLLPQQSPHCWPRPWVLFPFCSIPPPPNLHILLSMSLSQCCLLVQLAPHMTEIITNTYRLHNFTDSCGCVVVSHCGFNLHFSWWLIEYFFIV